MSDNYSELSKLARSDHSPIHHDPAPPESLTWTVFIKVPDVLLLMACLAYLRRARRQPVPVTVTCLFGAMATGARLAKAALFPGKPAGEEDHGPRHHNLSAPRDASTPG